MILICFLVRVLSHLFAIEESFVVKLIGIQFDLIRKSCHCHIAFELFRFEGFCKFYLPES